MPTAIVLRAPYTISHDTTIKKQFTLQTDTDVFFYIQWNLLHTIPQEHTLISYIKAGFGPSSSATGCCSPLHCAVAPSSETQLARGRGREVS